MLSDYTWMSACGSVPANCMRVVVPLLILDMLATSSRLDQELDAEYELDDPRTYEECMMEQEDEVPLDRLQDRFLDAVLSGSGS